MKSKNKKTIIIVSVLTVVGIGFYRIFIADEFMYSSYSLKLVN